MSDPIKLSVKRIREILATARLASDSVPVHQDVLEALALAALEQATVCECGRDMHLSCASCDNDD